MDDRFKNDAPTTGIVIRNKEEARALARSLFGDTPPNRMRFVCVSCGWDKTLEFEDAEVAALGGDVSEYSGPCANCKTMMLVPHGSVLAGTNIEEMAQKNFYKQVDEASDMVLDKVEQRITDLMGGGSAASAPRPKAPSGKPSVDDLPDEKDVQLGGKK
jgi:hypothetical protein